MGLLDSWKKIEIEIKSKGVYENISGNISDYF
jgi:hypothetical protein